LDILEPSARAQVAAHLIRCDDCRETVSGMQDSAARLLDLGSPWDPQDWPEPADVPPVRPARRRFRVAVTVAAAAMLLVGTALGPEIEQVASRSEGQLASAVLMAGGQPVGSVHLYGGPTPAIDVEVTALSAAGPLAVVLVTRNGKSQRLGQMQLAGGKGRWIGANPVAATDVNGLALDDQAGNILALAGAS
jgi:hypothetical protein